MKALVGAFNQEKALIGAFSVIVQPVVEPMDRFTALNLDQSAYYSTPTLTLLTRLPSIVARSKSFHPHYASHSHNEQNSFY